MCPLGGFAFYHHYIHDVKNITQSMSIDWAINKTWRSVRILLAFPILIHQQVPQARVLSGPKSPSTPFSEQSLYNLYAKAFHKAGFVSKVKVHLPRHTLGYKQEAMGYVTCPSHSSFLKEFSVDSEETSKLGWVRGETYFDTYRPAIPKIVSFFPILLTSFIILNRPFLPRTGSNPTKHMIQFGATCMFQMPF